MVVHYYYFYFYFLYYFMYHPWNNHKEVRCELTHMKIDSLLIMNANL